MKIAKHILLIVLVAFCFKATARDKTIDSLKVALKAAKNDSTRCIILNQLSESAEDNEWPGFTEQLRQLAGKNIQKSEHSKSRIFYLTQYANALNNLAYLEAVHNYNLQKAIKIYEEVLKYRILTKDMINIAKTYESLANIASNSNDTTNSLNYISKAFRILDSLGNKGEQAKLLRQYAKYYEDHGNNSIALRLYKNSLKLYEELKEYKDCAMVSRECADIYATQGQIQQALSINYKSLKYFETANDSNEIANSLNSLAFLFNIQKDYKKAIDFALKSLQLITNKGSLIQLSLTLNNLGVYYRNNGNKDKALKYFRESLVIKEKTNDNSGIAYCLNNIGHIYIAIGNPDEAINLLRKSILLHKKINNKIGLAYSYRTISEAYFLKGNYETSIRYGLISLKLAKEQNLNNVVREASASLYKNYSQTHKWKEAFEYYELYNRINDTINSNENKKSSLQQDFQYQYEKKAAADSVKNAEEQKVKNAQLTAQQAQLKQERTQRFALYGGLLLVVAFSGFVFNRFKITQKQKTIIENQKEEVDNAYGQLHEKNNEVMDSIRYARRIQNSLLTTEKYIHTQINRLSEKN